MTNPHPTAVAIAGQITDRKPTTECALGHGLHQARMEQDAALLQTFCKMLGLNLYEALQAIESGVPIACAARVPEDAYT